MHGGKGQNGGGGYDRDHGFGGGSGYRDRGDRNDGGYRDRGGHRDRGGDRGYGGGGGVGFHSSGPKVSNVNEGSNTLMLSNHFRFKTNTVKELIYIYIIDYGVFDTSRDHRIGAIKSLDNDLKKIFNVYTFYSRYLYSIESVIDENIRFNASYEGK